jgi:hypothetical protein
LGGSQSVGAVYIKWHDAYAQDYDIQAAYERPNCRSDGDPCPDAWIAVDSIDGKSNADATTDYFDGAPQGVRYIRINLTKRAAGSDNFSIYYIRVYRKKMIVGSTPTNQFCGNTVADVTNSLLSQYGGTLIQSYENAEYFSASMTAGQKDAMFGDDCVFTVEPNYVVKARGITGNNRGAASITKKRLGDSNLGESSEKERNLAIPEFNLRDESPPSKLYYCMHDMYRYNLLHVFQLKPHISCALHFLSAQTIRLGPRTHFQSWQIEWQIHMVPRRLVWVPAALLYSS